MVDRIAFGAVRSVYDRIHWFPDRVPGYPWSACGTTRDSGKPGLPNEEPYGMSEDDCPLCVVLWYESRPRAEVEVRAMEEGA